MRLPEGLRGPPRLQGTWWIAGAGVLVILIFVVMAMPWHEIGRRVHDSELPRPRFHTGGWCGVRCTGFEEPRMITIDRRGEPDPSPERLGTWIGKSGFTSFNLRAHRQAPWSAVTRVLEALVRGGQTSIALQVGPSQYLSLELEAAPSASEVTISALPLPDPEGVLAAARGRPNAARDAPVVRLAFTGDPAVEDVLHALECYAGDGDSVRVAVRR